jgi:hypothetical protein
MRSLSNFVFHDGAQFLGKDNYSPVRMNTARTTSGNLLIQTQALHGGRSITIAYADGLAILTAAEKDTLRTMAHSVGASYLLTWDNEVFTVMFDHSNGDALNFQPLWGFVYHDKPEQTLFTAQIKLISL